MRLLAISGSLRAASANTAVLHAVRALAPEQRIEIELYEGLGGLPFFNPDLDRPDDRLPPSVQDLRRRIGEADGMLICSPEYAHGVPGAMKNLLDWLVSGPEMVGKPVGLINASPLATHAQASLTETLTVMSARLVPGASVTLPVTTNRLDAATLAADPELSARLRSCLAAFARELCDNRRG